jgi:3-oxoacyl-[acyl-carrier-protein] synthase-3
MSNASIKAISYYLPTKVLSNIEIALEHPEWSVEKISLKTGIYNRHISAKDEFSSDMAVKAALKLFSEHNINKEEIDFILLCTQSPDYFLPTTACLIQDRLGLRKNIGAFDFNLGCSGFVYGIGIAKGLIETGQANNVLLLTSETYSKFIHPDDKSNKTIFGDAAAATLISNSEGNSNIYNFEYYTNGEKYDKLIVKNGGLKNRFDKGENILDDDLKFIRNNDFLFMDGKEIFNFTMSEVPNLVNNTLKKNNLKIENIDLFVFHQANAYMMNSIRKRIGIQENLFLIDLHEYANTVSSTIPIALSNALKNKIIPTGSKVLIAGFGVGLSMASTVIKF